MRNFLLPAILLFSISAPVGAVEGITAERLAIARAVLALEPEGIDPNALEQARELVAGRKGKSWKNCVLDSEGRRLVTHSGAGSR